MPSSSPVEVLITVSLPDVLVEQLKELSPRLRITHQPVHRADDIPAEVWARTEVLYTTRVLPEPGRVPNLRWVQFTMAGIDFVLGSPLLQKPDLIVTTLSGVAAPQVAEFALMMMMALGHHLPDLAVNQERAEWPQNRWDRFLPREVGGSTVGLVGYGSIGRELARLLRPFGCTILALKRDAMHPEDTGFTLEGMGDVEGNHFHRLYPPQAINSMVQDCDFIVVSLPLTAATRGLVGIEQFKAMKPTAYLVDVGRGGVVEPAGLVSALQENLIAGAALDVFAEEPIPPTHPLWQMPNVIITPHVCGISSSYNVRAVMLFSENLRRYLSGVTLLNRFEAERGY